MFKPTTVPSVNVFIMIPEISISKETLKRKRHLQLSTIREHLYPPFCFSHAEFHSSRSAPSSRPVITTVVGCQGFSSQLPLTTESFRRQTEIECIECNETWQGSSLINYLFIGFSFIPCDFCCDVINDVQIWHPNDHIWSKLGAF